MCRLLPLWTSLLDELACEAVWVLVTRHPYENIQSLEKRDGFSPEKSALLWLQHTLDAERKTRNRTRVVITYDQLFENWEATLDRVRRAADLQWPVPHERAAAQIKRFVDPAKRHHHAGKAGDLPRWISEAYEALQIGAAGDDEKMQAALTAAHDAFDTADTFYRPIIRDRAVDLERSLTRGE